LAELAIVTGYKSIERFGALILHDLLGLIAYDAQIAFSSAPMFYGISVC
jgi:hypothetical protein